MTITSTIESVTPLTATEWLKQNTGNRPLTKAVVDRFAAAMRRGEWMVTGEPIVFDANGRLLSGQHRLHACLLSGVTFSSSVVRGVETKAFEVIDSGKPRSAADALAMKGRTNYVKLAAGARAYLELTGQCRRGEITTPVITELVAEKPALETWTHRFVKCVPRIFPSALIGHLTRASELYGYETIDDFATKLFTGAGVQTGDPALVLRNRFASKAAGTLIPPDHAAAYIVQAINAHVKGGRLSFVRLTGLQAPPVFTPPNKANSVSYNT